MQTTSYIPMFFCQWPANEHPSCFGRHTFFFQMLPLILTLASNLMTIACYTYVETYIIFYSFLLLNSINGCHYFSHYNWQPDFNAFFDRLLINTFLPLQTQSSMGQSNFKRAIIIILNIIITFYFNALYGLLADTFKKCLKYLFCSQFC